MLAIAFTFVYGINKNPILCESHLSTVSNAEFTDYCRLDGAFYAKKDVDSVTVEQL